jgi:SAM-dependent methyltransferase
MPDPADERGDTPVRNDGGTGSADARRHYAKLDEPDSQTSPGIVQSNLRSWIEGADVAGPILDIGTGNGANLDVLAARHRVIGCDVSAAAARRAAEHHRIVVCDGAQLPFRDGSFGAVVCTEVLEHVDEPGDVLSEMARVLRPDGLAYTTSPNYANLAGAHKFLVDRRSGRHDWNPWGAHVGGYEAFNTGWRIWGKAKRWFSLERVRGLDFGQALTGRFAMLDRIAWSKPGRTILGPVLRRVEGASGRMGWFAMHTELVLRKRS